MSGAMLALVALAAATGPAASAAGRPPRTALAPTPPMGWNSWDCYGTSVTEAEVKANADAMARELAPYGWTYVVVDIQWYEPNARAHGYRENAELVTDAYGRLQPAANRFPSAAGGRGFKPLADYVHARGLKFGIHVMRGIPRQAVRANLPILGTKARAAEAADTQSTCAWNTDMYGVDVTKPAGRAYYDSLARLYASWGVDYVKADDMSSPLHAGEIAALRRALTRCGRPIVLSLSPGPAPLDEAAFFREHAQLWRISNDFWDRWDDLKRAFGLCREWAPHVGQGAWPDADMLPLGRIGIRAERGDDRMTRFTRDEQVTLMTLWSMFRSPLMFGGDIPSDDAFTRSLLTNPEVLAVDQHSTGNRELFARGNQVAWVADDPATRGRYVALFNVGDASAETVRVAWRDVGLEGPGSVRDLWQRKELGTFADGFAADVAPHGAVLIRVGPARTRE